MKICYLCPDLGISVDGHKGASSHIRGFIRALSESGHSVELLTTCFCQEGTLDIPLSIISEPEILEGLLQEPHPRTYRALRHLFYNTAIGEGLREKVLTQQPDVVYERYSPFSVAGGITAKKMQVPHILEVNSPLAEQGKRYRKQALQEASELLEITAFNNTNLIITLTEDLREWLISLGIPPGKVKVRPSGGDPEVFSPNGPSYQDKFKGKVVLGFVGSLKPWHDIELLVKIFKKLIDDPRYHLLVCGDGPMRKEIEALAVEYPERLTATGAVSQDEIGKYLRSMDIALAPYPDLDLFYFSPLKVYEYMATGRAVVATGIGQLKQLIDHGQNGLLVPPGEFQAWVDAIKFLADDVELRRSLGYQARQEVLMNHSWNHRVKTFIAIVEEFLRSHEVYC